MAGKVDRFLNNFPITYGAAGHAPPAVSRTIYCKHFNVQLHTSHPYFMQRAMCAIVDR